MNTMMNKSCEPAAVAAANADNRFIEIGHYQNGKWSQGSVGDVFLSRKTPGDDRTVCVLADGLGSGVKANVLATLTATMALKFVAADIDMRKSSEIIMSTLPVCSKRKIGYSTFTIMDIGADGTVKIMEYDNPPYILMRRGELGDVAKRSLEMETKHLGVRELRYSGFMADVGDRIVAFTDGVSQSGIGTKRFPLGWTDTAAKDFVRDVVARNPDISARNLARAVVAKAAANDGSRAQDDISCAVVYFREPRRLMVMTGPPISPARDRRMADTIRDFHGKKIISGGTTANIVARELGLKVSVDLSEIDPVIPPSSSMRGIDLVTEGTLTLSRTADLLEKGADPENMRRNAATRMLEHFLESDIIQFVVGTKINDAHQDPNLPAELDIRRNLIKRIVGLLESKYLKEASIQYI